MWQRLSRLLPYFGLKYLLYVLKSHKCFLHCLAVVMHQSTHVVTMRLLSAKHKTVDYTQYLRVYSKFRELNNCFVQYVTEFFLRSELSHTQVNFILLAMWAVQKERERRQEHCQQAKLWSQQRYPFPSTTWLHSLHSTYTVTLKLIACKCKIFNFR